MEKFWTAVKEFMAKYCNKYVLTLLVFGIVFVFVGDQSLLRRWHNARLLHQLEKQREVYTRDIETIEQDLHALQQTDSLERFARETYFMHAPNEDVYVVKE